MPVVSLTMEQSSVGVEIITVKSEHLEATRIRQIWYLLVRVLTATSIHAGGNHNCAILSDGSVKCWGQNSDGQLGIGTG